MKKGVFGSKFSLTLLAIASILIVFFAAFLLGFKGMREMLADLLFEKATMGTATADISKDTPGELRFFGSADAELFTKEIEASLQGVLAKNYKTDYRPYMPGYITASVDGRPWHDTLWSRDGGTFLRELVLWGYLQRACLTAECLIKLVQKNKEGFYTFPEYFKGTKPASGTELDGTASIIIGMTLLWQRLPEGDSYKEKVYQFLHQESSPLRYLHLRPLLEPLVAGSGEFGGGCGIKGEWYNVVQNHLVVLALIAGSRMENQAGDLDLAELYRQDAEVLSRNIRKYLVDEEGAWIWCIDPKTLLPDSAIINHPINRGFGGLNGVACMYADVLGLEPIQSNWWGAEPSEKTFAKLYAVPLRRQQFQKYGIWSQFDVFREGMSSGPSYGDGYALQTMLLYDKLDMADKSLHYLANATFNPPPEYRELERESPYHFYERYYSPDVVGKMKLEQGCGALNLVNVAEPLKVARLILGVDDYSSPEVKIIPRVPPSWSGYEAKNWPILTEKGVARVDIRYEKRKDRQRFSLKVKGWERIPNLAVRFSTLDGIVWRERKDGGKVEWNVE